MTGIEFEGDCVARPAQDTFKMKKIIQQQKTTIFAQEAKIKHFEAAVRDAAKTIFDLEEKIRSVEEKLLKRVAK